MLDIAGGVRRLCCVGIGWWRWWRTGAGRGRRGRDVRGKGHGDRVGHGYLLDVSLCREVGRREGRVLVLGFEDSLLGLGCEMFFGRECEVRAGWRLLFGTGIKG